MYYKVSKIHKLAYRHIVWVLRSAFNSGILRVPVQARELARIVTLIPLLRAFFFPRGETQGQKLIFTERRKNATLQYWITRLSEIQG